MFLKSHRPGASSAAQGLRGRADVGAHRELRERRARRDAVRRVRASPLGRAAQFPGERRAHRARCLPHYFFEPVHDNTSDIIHVAHATHGLWSVHASISHVLLW